MTAGFAGYRRAVFGEAGISLLETMVAAAIGAIVISGALDVFVTHQGHFLGQKTKAELQQDLRGGMAVLAGELRMAGAGNLREQTAERGERPALTAMGPTALSFRANVNDIRGILAAAAPSGQGWVQVSPGGSWTRGKTVILCGRSGCEERRLGRTGISGRLELTEPLSRDFPAGSQIEVVNQVRYYLNNGKLMREVDRGANPLIEQVEALLLTYLTDRGEPAWQLEEVRLVQVQLRTGGRDGRGGRVTRTYTGDMGVRTR